MVIFCSLLLHNLSFVLLKPSDTYDDGDTMPSWKMGFTCIAQALRLIGCAELCGISFGVTVARVQVLRCWGKLSVSWRSSRCMSSTWDLLLEMTYLLIKGAILPVTLWLHLRESNRRSRHINVIWPTSRLFLGYFLILCQAPKITLFASPN